ncbi:hypothetical protein SG26_20025 (plasmid) [Haloarcula sp. CBA1115]|uniref:hypothetical protein n=1 Tax=unclassified Haloarcula TaxID=2624677 RepID=UPI00059554BD|nr:MULTISPECIES: hypothetical protein [unclassified Haloarcula]AJF28038.1 hypothetical protein SG26_20025 [Haloarcula sp. CBA1115]
MERDAKQPILGRCALWINDLDLSKSYWILLLTNYGIYDEENEHIQNLLNKAEKSSSIILSSLQRLQKSRLEVTLEFFMWLYHEDEELCFEILKYIYQDFKDDDEVPEPYAYVDELEDLKEGGDFPQVDLDQIVPATPKAFEDGDELEFYYQTKNKVSRATEEVFIIDAYANEEVIWYLKETSEDIEKRILTQGKKEGLSNAAEKLVSNSNHRIEVRRNGKCHDRLIFVDDQCFAIGDSLHAAGTKPMYAVKFGASEKFRQPWEQMWEQSQEYAVFED